MKINLNIYEELSVDDKRRFYPEYFPVMMNEPLRSNFIILQSPEDIHKGLLSLVTFDKEDLIVQCAGTSLFFQTLHSLQYKEGMYLHDPFFAGYLLHSCDPNAELNMRDFTLHAIKPIKHFELITIDYEKTEAQLYQGFNCQCGSFNCKGWIEGYIYRKKQNEHIENTLTTMEK